MGFTPLDYAVLVSYLILSAALGFYFARFQHSSRDYFLGSRNIPWLAVSLSIVATETSTLTFIGIPALAFSSNMAFLQITAGYFIARIVISVFFLPAYYRGEMYTAYTFLEQRFGPGARKTAALIFMITRLFADGVRLFATAIPLKIMTGLSYPVSISIICLITMLYTYFGGLRAVVWLDVTQFLVYLAGAGLAAMAILGKLAGGWQDIALIAEQAEKFTVLDFHLDWTTTYTVFSGLIGGTFLTMASHGTDQLLVQRLLACRNLRDSQKALIGSGVFVIGQFYLFLLLGVMLFAFYQVHPQQLQISRADEVFPYFIAHELPPGLGGMILAALFAAAMSTLSSSLNSLSSSTMMDWIKPLLQKNWDAARELRYSRYITVGWALLLVIVAVLAGNWDNVLEAGLKIASFTYGGLLGAFLLGLAQARIAERQIVPAMLIGLGTMLLVSLTALAWPWYVAVGAMVTTIAALVLRLLGFGQPRS